ncbi:MAG: IS3 family transposase [Nitrospiraceae bacterium]
MGAVLEMLPTTGVEFACQGLGVSRATFHRHHPIEGPARAGSLRSQAEAALALIQPLGPPERRRSFRALSSQEEQQVLDCLHSERFQDCAPAAIVATLLDENVYHCSTRTMYRILDKHSETRERRAHRIHPVYAKPELVANGPNEVWSWDITKLRGPVKYSYFYLYVILDIYSRYVVGWTVQQRESDDLAHDFIEETILKYDIPPGQLLLHADRGKVMRSGLVSTLLENLTVSRTHSRPYVSNDNPYSESQFRTLKYRPGFPDRFGCCQDSRAFCHQFFPWYNQQHRHSGLGMLTPEMVHFGQAKEVLFKQQVVMDTAYDLHPERFVRHAPKLKSPPLQVWINPPATAGEQTPKPH